MMVHLTEIIDFSFSLQSSALESTRTSDACSPERPPVPTTPYARQMPCLSPLSQSVAAVGNSPAPPLLTPQHPNPDIQPPPVVSPIPVMDPIEPPTDEERDVAADIPYQPVDPVEEDSIDDDITVGHVSVPEVDEVEYKLAGKTEKGKPQLVDTQGYSYVVKSEKPHVTYWR